MIFETTTAFAARKRPTRSGSNSQETAKRPTIQNPLSMTTRSRASTQPAPSTTNYRLQSNKRLVMMLLGFIAVFFLVLIISFSFSDADGLRTRTPTPSLRLSRQAVTIYPEITKLRKQFPISIHKEDMEEILHPGLVFAGSDRMKLMLPEEDAFEKLLVPKFWNPVTEAFPEEGPRAFLAKGQGLNQPMTMSQAKSIGSFVDEHETIFVSIASYRDDECRLTVESVFERASLPQRLRVVVVDQREPEDNPCIPSGESCRKNPDQSLCRFLPQIDVFEAKAHQMVGPVLARHLAHRMYRNEYFTLQVDAHVRFIQDWDEDIVRQWKSASNEMAVLTTYLTDIAGSIDPQTHKSLREDRNMMCQLAYEGQNDHAHLILKSPSKSRPKVHGSPMLHPFWSAGFSFGRGHFLVQVPYDQHLPMVFNGEESSIAVRAFTYGYDFYAPERSVAFHIFAIKENVGRRERHKFWEYEVLYGGALDKSLTRIAGITGMAGSSTREYYRTDDDKYGLGRVRTPATFFQTFGIHPQTQSIEAHLCTFVQGRMHEEFSRYLRSDGMGIDYAKVDFKFAA